MKIVVLDKIAMGEDTPIEVLNSLGELVTYDSTAPYEVPERVKDAEVIVTNKVKITKTVIEEAKRLKLICVFATGFDNIDVTAAKHVGVAVCNVPGYSTDSVAMFTVATVLSLAAHLKEYGSYVSQGKYSESSSANKITPVFHEIRGLTWGIVGCGNIGSAVLKIAEALGARVIVNKTTPSQLYECVDIDTLCKTSDIITLHCPLNDKTRELIDSKRISMMKKSVILVNEARGAVVNEADVAAAVKEGRIAAFGCDVYSTEPFSKSHPYYEIKDMDNVILTPHAAWAAYEARTRCIKIIRDNIFSFINGEKLNRVDVL